MEIMDSDDNETDKINVVPLADLSLVLLIIMMLMAPAALSSMIRVETPRVDKVKASRSKPAKSGRDPLFVKISKTGITLNNTPMDSVELLGEQIAIKLHADPERAVIVAADEDILVDSVVHVLDICKQKGADKISLLKGAQG